VLLEHLATAARERGITRFVADTLPTNRRMLEVVAEAGFDERTSYEAGVVRVELAIEPTDTARAAVEERDHRAESRSMARLLTPGSVAVVGASRDPATVGHQVLRNLLAGGFASCSDVASTAPPSPTATSPPTALNPCCAARRCRLVRRQIRLAPPAPRLGHHPAHLTQPGHANAPQPNRPERPTGRRLPAASRCQPHRSAPDRTDLQPPVRPGKPASERPPGGHRRRV
jgi:hypothetical protein